MKCPNCGAEAKGKFCEFCGSELPKEKATINITNNYYVNAEEKPRSKSNNRASTTTKSKKKRTWLWVLGWICIFPLPLTILLLRKKNMKPAVKYGIIAVAWLLFFAIGSSGNSETEAPSSTVPSHTEAVELAPTEEITTEPTEVVLSAATYIDDVVSKYNEQATEQLVFVESFDPQDRDNGHYRVEFRLSAYNEAIGKSYLLGDKVVDLVAHETYLGGISFRVYTNDVSLEQVVNLIQGMSPIMDTTMSEADLQATIEEVSTKKTANGYYYGELGITLFGSDVKGYELMIKTD